MVHVELVLDVVVGLEVVLVLADEVLKVGSLDDEEVGEVFTFDGGSSGIVGEEADFAEVVVLLLECELGLAEEDLDLAAFDEVEGPVVEVGVEVVEVEDTLFGDVDWREK